jgi:ankyrin repeat protein
MPLLWAAYQGHMEVAQVLVDAGAALSATDKVRTPVSCAAAAAGSGYPL